MNKQKFLDELEKKLSVLPKSDIEERLNFYGEIIDDYIEEGLSEEDAILKIGSLDEIVTQILSDYSPTSPENKKKPQKRAIKGWVTVLLILGFPLWLPLLIGAFAIIFSLYVSLWAAIISTWAIFGSVIACAVYLLIWGIAFAFSTNIFGGVAILGAGVVLAGISVFLFFGCKIATKIIITPIKLLFKSIKKRF